ncbi:MAG TPA: hypothetical protein VHG28_03585 [Longimicrobiaceae bacterium]|nr:hypothetical protein [Longimicrobiaceae bacterium]
MEPQENKQIMLRKAINVHEQAEAALADLMQDGADPKHEAMLERIRQNLAELNAEVAVTRPADRV